MTSHTTDPTHDTEQLPLLTEVRDGALWITFNRPRRLNAATPEMEGLMSEALESAIDPASRIRAVVFAGATGTKPAFMAGNDTDTFGAVESEADVVALEEQSARTLEKIENLPVPTIAVLDGAVIGEGALIAACCDIVLCGPSVKFGFPIARTVGNCLTTRNLRRLTQMVGVPYVRSMIMRARLLDGTELAAAGATLDVAETADELESLAVETVHVVASLAPLTLRGTKETLLRELRAAEPVDNWDLVLEAYLSADSREALAAFAEKRTPRWCGQ